MLKVGVIGVGGISRAHMPGWEASEHAEVVAGADLNEKVLNVWGDKHQVRKLSTDPEELFADDEIDIIDICTPNMTHAPLVIAALEAGKHVLCEKPLAPTPTDIQRMIEARDRAGKLLMAGQNFRFTNLSQAFKHEIDKGVLGNIYHARSWMLRRNAFIPTPTFTEKRLSGGGACIDIGVHVLDLTLWMMGHPKAVTVSGVTGTHLAHHDGVFSAWHPGTMPKHIDVEEFAAAFVRFEHGGTLMLEVAWLLHHETESEDMQMWFYGTDGGCHWPSTQFLSSDYPSKTHRKQLLTASKDLLGSHAKECIAFAKAVLDGGPSPVPAEESLQVLTILDALYQSQAQNREVRIRE